MIFLAGFVSGACLGVAVFSWALDRRDAAKVRKVVPRGDIDTLFAKHEVQLANKTPLRILRSR